jgi:hypothetical protein
MKTLFSPSVYSSEGFCSRFKLLNLLPISLHCVLFGFSTGSSAEGTGRFDPFQFLVKWNWIDIGWASRSISVFSVRVLCFIFCHGRIGNFSAEGVSW